MPKDESNRQNPAHSESLVDRAIDVFEPHPRPPHRGTTPRVDEHAWEKSVEQVQIVPGLTIHDVGLSVHGETRSYQDGPRSNEPIGAAPQKVAHVIINGAELAHRTGGKPPSVHAPVEPSSNILANRDERAAYDSSLRAAREAYLDGHDPTHGATHFNVRGTPDRSNWKGKMPISTQSGPFSNSFRHGDVRSKMAWLNTYFAEK